MSSAEIASLQARLKDDRCYSDPIDGEASDATSAAIAACPDQRPQLRIETGMHVGPITQLGVDAACRIAATASQDSTVRIWSLPDGQLLRTLRLPIGAGKTGKLNAAAVSPNGRWVAVGGVDPQHTTDPVHPRVAVYIFNAATGALAARVFGFDFDILHLTFSPDGRWLAVSVLNASMKIIDMTTGRVIVAGKGYGNSKTAAFGPDGRLYSFGSIDMLQRYGAGPNFQEEQRIELDYRSTQGFEHYSLAVDPSGKLLAVSVFDKDSMGVGPGSFDAKIGILKTDDLTVQSTTDTGRINRASVAWRSDGERLAVGGDYREGAGKAPLLIFDRAGKRLDAVPAAEKSIADIVPCGKGFAVATTDPGFGLADGEGRIGLWRQGAASDLRDEVGNAFTVSANAQQVRFGLAKGAADAVRFDLAQATLSAAQDASRALKPADTTSLSVEGLNDHKGFTYVEGALLPMNLNEYPRALAIQPNRAGFVLGSDSYLRRYNVRRPSDAPPPKAIPHVKSSNPAFDSFFNKAERGQLDTKTHVVVAWAKAAPDVAWGTNLSADGRIVIAAYGDGTVRWHRWSDGQELLALFVNKQDRTWVAWTPAGYYMASPGGENMIGWHVNRGWDQAADFFPASRFRDQFSRPDVVQKILDTLDEAEAVRQADAARGGKVAPAKPLLERLPPVITILSPAPGASVGDDVQVQYLVRSPSNMPVDAVETLIDGRPPSASRGLARVSKEDALTQCLAETQGLGRSEGGLQGCRSSLAVHLPAGAREIALFARSGDRTSEVVRVQLVREAVARGTAEPQTSKLYALVVGISAYANADYALTYPAKDARDFAASLANQKGGQYGDVEIRTLTDGQATERAIKSGLDWLTKQVTSHDVGLVYLAGHGMLDDRERFYFLAADSDATQLRATAVPRDDIADALDALPGKALLFLDACHAGAVALGRRDAVKPGTLNVNAVVNDLADAEHGVTVFAASTGRQLSQENASWNNGAFTKAVVEGLGLPGNKARADLVGTGAITTSELDAYVANRVKMLTSGEQSPVMIRPATVPDFPLAMAR